MSCACENMSMTEHKTFPGKTYCVTCAEGCTVTDSSGALNMECEAGKQLVVSAPSDMLFTSAPAVVRETFNSAPAKLRLLGLLGGGAQALPAGYLAAEFLENGGKQQLMTNIAGHSALRVQTKIMRKGSSSSPYVFSCSNSSPFFGYLVTAWNSGEFRFDYGNEMLTPGIECTIGKVFLLEKDGAKNYINNELVSTNSEATFTATAECLSFFRRAGVCFIGIIYFAKVWDDSLIADFIPALDPQGVPCMFDKVSKQPFYNSGSGAFIVGMTLAQARKLGKLPATGGTLTVSLPTGYEYDEGVVNALETARANGWTLTVQTYTPEAETAATTFGMRRIWVRRTQDENGTYVSADGSRWQVDWCVAMYTPDGSEPDAHGYELFRSVDAATEYWGLEPWVDPEAEEILTENITND